MSKAFIKRISVLLAVLVMLGLGGCATDNGEVVEDPVKENGEEEVVVVEETIIVTDGLGRQVELPNKVERIVTNYGIAGHMVFALGLEDKLVGADMPSKNNEFFNAIKPDYSSLPTPGSPGETNVEEVISLKPDIIIVPGRNIEMVELLEEHGLPVFGVVAEDLEQLETTIENLGKAFGAEERAEKFIKHYNETIEMIEEKTKNIEEEDRPGVYVAGSMGLFSTCSKDMYQNGLIELAGGRNVAEELEGGRWVDISAEQLISWNPDVIVVVQYTSAITPEEIMKDERLKETNAVKNGQVFWFPSNINPWDYPSPQAVLGIQWLSQKLHPDKFEFDMEEEADEFFKMLYGVTFSEIGGELD